MDSAGLIAHMTPPKSLIDLHLTPMKNLSLTYQPEMTLIGNLKNLN